MANLSAPGPESQRTASLDASSSNLGEFGQIFGLSTDAGALLDAYEVGGQATIAATAAVEIDLYGRQVMAEEPLPVEAEPHPQAAPTFRVKSSRQRPRNPRLEKLIDFRAHGDRDVLPESETEIPRAVLRYLGGVYIEDDRDEPAEDTASAEAPPEPEQDQEVDDLGDYNHYGYEESLDVDLDADAAATRQEEIEVAYRDHARTEAETAEAVAEAAEAEIAAFNVAEEAKEGDTHTKPREIPFCNPTSLREYLAFKNGAKAPTELQSPGIEQAA